MWRMLQQMYVCIREAFVALLAQVHVDGVLMVGGFLKPFTS